MTCRSNSWPGPRSRCTNAPSLSALLPAVCRPQCAGACRALQLGAGACVRGGERAFGRSGVCACVQPHRRAPVCARVCAPCCCHLSCSVCACAPPSIIRDLQVKLLAWPQVPVHQRTLAVGPAPCGRPPAGSRRVPCAAAGRWCVCCTGLRAAFLSRVHCCRLPGWPCLHPCIHACRPACVPDLTQCLSLPRAWGLRPCARAPLVPHHGHVACLLLRWATTRRAWPAGNCTCATLARAHLPCALPAY